MNGIAQSDAMMGVERSLGQLEGRFDSLDRQLSEMTHSLTAQIAAHDARTKASTEALRQDFVVAITEARKRTEAIAEEFTDKFGVFDARLGKLEGAGLRREGAQSAKASFWETARSVAPMFFGGGGVVSIVVLILDKVH